MEAITSAKKEKLKHDLIVQMILGQEYHINEIRNRIRSSNVANKDKLVYLLDLLEKEINHANGIIEKKLNKVKSLGTID
jgi:hypothetical protein